MSPQKALGEILIKVTDKDRYKIQGYEIFKYKIFSTFRTF